MLYLSPVLPQKLHHKCPIKHKCVVLQVSDMEVRIVNALEKAQKALRKWVVLAPTESVCVQITFNCNRKVEYKHQEHHSHWFQFFSENRIGFCIIIHISTFTLFFLSLLAASPTCIQLACLYLAVTLHRGEKSTEILSLKLLSFNSPFSLVP